MKVLKCVFFFPVFSMETRKKIIDFRQLAQGDPFEEPRQRIVSDQLFAVEAILGKRHLNKVNILYVL